MSDPANDDSERIGAPRGSAVKVGIFVLLALTYGVVLFSILVQGLTIGRLVRQT